MKQALKATKTKYKVAAQSLKDSLVKKEETIVQLSNKVEVLSRNRDNNAQQHRTEERLVMSALYEVGLEMQRRMVTHGGVSSNVSGPSSSNMSSWLNKRRHRSGGSLTTPPQPFLDTHRPCRATPFTRHLGKRIL